MELIIDKEVKTALTLLLVVMVSFTVTAQNSKSYDVEFIVNGKKITNVRYYYLHHDTAYQLQYINDKLVFGKPQLEQKRLKIAAVFGRKMIEFAVETEDFFYIKIEKYREGLKTLYTVNHGSEYMEIVKAEPVKKLIYKN